MSDTFEYSVNGGAWESARFGQSICVNGRCKIEVRFFGKTSRAPLPAEQPSNPVPLTNNEIFTLADDWCAGQAPSGNYLFRRLRLVEFVRLIEARIVGQQTKESGNGSA